MTATGILIYAAGLGTRMGPLTAERPKPLIPVAGRALIDHALALVEAAAPPVRPPVWPPVWPPVRQPVRVVNLHYRAGMLRAHLAGRGLAFSDETDLLRETGGGLKHAADLLGDGPVLTLNSDAVWKGENPLALLQAAWRAGMEGLVLVVDRAEAVGHGGGGDFVLAPDGRVTRGPGLVYTGAQMVRTARFLSRPARVFSTNVIWDGMIAEGTLFGLRYPGRFADVGRPEAIALAEAMLGQAP